MELLSLRAYARHRNVTLAAVQKAIETKRITTIADERGKKKIDPEVADIQWAKNTRPDQQERGSLKDFEKTQADLASYTNANFTGDAARLPGEPGKENNNIGLSVEKAETEQVRRQLMELSLQQKRGELVKVEDIERAMASKLKAANEALNNLADRLAPILAAETNVDVVDRMLRTEIRRAMSLIAQEAPETTQ